MKTIDINIQDAIYFAGKEKFESLRDSANAAVTKINDGTGTGADFLGWVTLPSSITAEETARIKSVAERLRSRCDYVVVVGIGGSYLGAKAVNFALSDAFIDLYPNTENQPKILYAGQNLSEDYLAGLQRLLKGKKFGIIVISKSGTTTEPAIAFRILRTMLEEQAGKAEAKELIVAVTDTSKGALRTLATQEGYDTFVIPDNVGGRFSVLTPVGLLPIAVAGYDIDKLISGAVDMENETHHPGPSNPAQTYAMIRNALYQDGKKIEIFVDFDPRLHFLAEWWKQLFGESEGKEGKGIFPASADMTTDLHSLGQWIQEGERTIFETVVELKHPAETCVIPSDAENLDGLNYLAGRRISLVNEMAQQGTRLAHVDGNVPVVRITAPHLDEHSLGELIYFFEKACAISGYMLGVNPFNQPGVEAYKKNMFALLGKPGYEAQGEALRSRLATDNK